MAEAVEYEQFDGPGAGHVPEGEADLSRLREVPVEISVEVGRTRMTVGQALDLRPGSVVTLERIAGEPADLLVNGTPVARGEIVVVDEQFGLRVTEILAADEDGEAPAPAPVVTLAPAPPQVAPAVLDDGPPADPQA